MNDRPDTAIGFIGFGEAGSAIARGIREAGAPAVAADQVHGGRVATVKPGTRDRERRPFPMAQPQDIHVECHRGIHIRGADGVMVQRPQGHDPPPFCIGPPAPIPVFALAAAVTFTIMRPTARVNAVLSAGG